MTKETSAAVDQAAIDAARAEGHAEGVKAGATAERTRIAAILASDEGKKRPKAAMSLAMKTALSLDEANASLADMPEETASATPTTPAKQFQAAVEEGAPGVTAGVSDEQQPSRAQRVAAMRGWDKKK